MGWGNPELVTTTFLCVFNDPLLDFPSVSHVFIASNQIFGAKSLWVCPALQRKGKAKLIIYPWQLICLITVAFSLFTHQKPQFPQIFGFVAITKAVKMPSHLSSCILRALKQAEKNNWIKHFSHLQIKVYNYLFLYRYNMYIFMSFYHPGSWMESEKQNFCVSALELHQQSALGTSPSQNPKSSSWLSLLSTWVLLSQLFVHVKTSLTSIFLALRTNISFSKNI